MRGAEDDVSMRSLPYRGEKLEFLGRAGVAMDAEGTYGATGRSGRLFRMGSAILRMVVYVKVRNERPVCVSQKRFERKKDDRLELVGRGKKDR